MKEQKPLGRPKELAQGKYRQVYLEAWQWEVLDREAKELRLSVSALLRQIVTDWSSSSAGR